MTLHQPEARSAFSRGSCPWITEPWQWRAAPAPGRGGVESDLCSHTGFLEAAKQPQHLTPVSGVHADNRGSRLSLDSALFAASLARLWGPR